MFKLISINNGDAPQCSIEFTEDINDDLNKIIDNHTNGYGVDGVIITASTKSNKPIELAANASRKKGRIILVGVSGLALNRDQFYKKSDENVCLDEGKSCSDNHCNAVNTSIHTLCVDQKIVFNQLGTVVVYLYKKRTDRGLKWTL